MNREEILQLLCKIRDFCMTQSGSDKDKDADICKSCPLDDVCAHCFNGELPEMWELERFIGKEVVHGQTNS